MPPVDGVTNAPTDPAADAAEQATAAELEALFLEQVALGAVIIGGDIIMTEIIELNQDLDEYGG